MDTIEQASAKRKPQGTMEQLFGEPYEYHQPQRGEIIDGTVVKIGPAEILVDIGSKTEGVVSTRELQRLPPESIDQIKVGDKLLVFVIKPEDADGSAILSLVMAQTEKDWRNAEKLFTEEGVFEGAVAGYNKGGLIVNFGELRGFVPASQLVSVKRPAAAEGEEEPTRESSLASLVGTSLRFKIIELDRRRNRLILSERVAMREWRKEQKERLLSELKEGDVCRGEVTSLCSFGAFVNLGGADGLIHLSELSWGRVMHLSEVLQVGDVVDVYVLGVDKEKRRIALSLKRLQPEPWSQVNERYTIGQLVQGTITKLTKFGAFAKLNEDIEGLIHITELSDPPPPHPKDVVKEGDVLTLRVIRIDPTRRRLGLSLKKASDAEYADLDTKSDSSASIPPAVEEPQFPPEPAT